MKALYRYWGKAQQPDNQEADDICHLLVYHSLDVAAVGKVLLERQPWLLTRLAKLMGLPPDAAMQWCIFLLGLHDLGKFAENFQQLRGDLRQHFWPKSKIRKRGYTVRHDSLGWMFWQQFLKQKVFPEMNDSLGNFVEDAFPYWLAAVFGHHGWPPEGQERLKSHCRDFDQRSVLDFFGYWQAFNRIDFNGLASLSEDNSFIQRQRRASWLLAGITVLSDWLGSNQEIFEFRAGPLSLDEYWCNYALIAAEKAVAAAGIETPMPRHGQKLGDLFDYIAEPTPLQQTCAELPIADEPQLFILEDVTGAGKTEAALMLAHRLIDAGLGGGIYIGLPTMATANAMYERMAEVYRRFYSEKDNPSLILSHSARHLSGAFQQSLLELQADDPRYGEEESVSAQCNRWLADNRKKALLADVGVGTIDQVLLAVMPARHQSLRLLGLANKVLILDEVHAYDAYTLETLKRLIRFHGALGGSVVLLSATLTRRQRQFLVDAYHGKNVADLAEKTYPLLTQVAASGDSKEMPLQTRASVERHVAVSFCHAEEVVLGIIRREVEQGRCVCWMRNTVADARDVWRLLVEADWLTEDRLHLFHSRYALVDRIAIEGRMLSLFGKQSLNEQRHGQVLIATQVVEQSLDLDFDVMISDLAPIDLLIQRAGRLQRHQRGERGAPVLHIHAPEFNPEPAQDWFKACFPKAHFVYPDTLVLWRTQKTLQEKGGWWMPENARELLEFVYDEEGGIPAGLLDARIEMEGETMSKRDAATFATLNVESGYTRTEHWDEEARIATRLGDESQTLYLARWQNGVLQPWCNEGRYPWDLSSLRVNAWQLQKLAPVDDVGLQQVLGELREKDRLFDENSFIVPLIQVGGRWEARGVNEKGMAVQIVYDEKTGLELNHDR